MKTTAKNKFDSIDKSKINSQATKDLLAKIEKGLNSKVEENQKRAEDLLDKIISQAKAKKADIFVSKKPEPKTTPSVQKAKAKVTKSKLEDLMDIIKKDPLLADFNSPRRVKGGGRSTPEIDAERKARESGSRVSHKGWKNQYGASKGGRRYYEYRENRIDRKAPNYGSKPWLKEGGFIHPSDANADKYVVVEIKADGSRREHNNFGDFDTAMMFASLKREFLPKGSQLIIEDKDGKKLYRSFKVGGEVDESTAMVLSQNKAIAHHTEELKKALEKDPKVEPWVVGKIERASTDISDVTHYLDGKSEYAKGGKLTEEDYEMAFEPKGYMDAEDFAKIDAKVMKEFLDRDKKAGVHEKFTQYWYNGGREKAIAKYGDDENEAWENAYGDFKDEFYGYKAKGGYMEDGGEISDADLKRMGLTRQEWNDMMSEEEDYINSWANRVRYDIDKPQVKTMHDDKLAKGGYVISEKDEYGYVYIIDSKGKKVSNSKIPSDIGYGKVNNKFLFKKRKYDGELGLKDAEIIIGIMNSKLAKGGYTTRRDIKLIVIKNPNKNSSKEYLTIEKEDFLNGLDKFEEGGKLSKNYTYIKRGDIDHVAYYDEKGKTQLDFKPKNGYWVSKKALVDAGMNENKPKNKSSIAQVYDKWEEEVTQSLADKIGVDYGDASAMVEVQGKIMKDSYVKNLSPQETADLIDKASLGSSSSVNFGDTSVKKGTNGWKAKTSVKDYKGYDWEITTMKTMKGDLVTNAVGGRFKQGQGYSTFEFTMYQDPNIRLMTSSPARITDKVVEAQHDKALKEFEKKVSEKYAKGGKIGFEGLSKKVAKNYVGKKVAPKYRKEYGETYDKAEAKEVGDKVASKVYRQQLAKMKEGGKLPEELGRYFIKTSKTKVVRISDLIPLRARPTGIENAHKYMKMAYNGEMERRKPITIYKSGGKYRIADGNSTYAVAKENGWKNIWAEVVKNPNMNNGTNNGIFEKAKEIRKAGESWQDAIKRAKAMK